MPGGPVTLDRILNRPQFAKLRTVKTLPVGICNGLLEPRLVGR